MKKTSRFLLLSILFISAQISSHHAAAQQFGDHALGPIWIEGFISLRQGIYTDLSCKVKGHGRINPLRDGAPNVLMIESLQLLSRANGQVPAFCHYLYTSNFPWRVTIGAVPTGLFVATTSNVSVVSIGIQSSQDGIISGCIGSIWSNATWAQQSAPFAHGAGILDPAYSTLTFANAPVTGASSPPCWISGTLEITRPHAPYVELS